MGTLSALAFGGSVAAVMYIGRTVAIDIVTLEKI